MAIVSLLVDPHASKRLEPPLLLILARVPNCDAVVLEETIKLLDTQPIQCLPCLQRQEQCIRRSDTVFNAREATYLGKVGWYHTSLIRQGHQLLIRICPLVPKSGKSLPNHRHLGKAIDHNHMQLVEPSLQLADLPLQLANLPLQLLNVRPETNGLLMMRKNM